MASSQVGAVAAIVSVGGRDGEAAPGGERVRLVRGAGVTSDDGRPGHRQLRLCDDATSIGRTGTQGVTLRTRGLELTALGEGRRLRVGPRAVVQLTEWGDGVVFGRCLRAGDVSAGDAIGTDASFDLPRFAVVTLSDRRASGASPDESGAIAVRILREALGADPLATDVLPDDATSLKRRLIELADEEVCDLIVTTGGTGLAPRDVTPDATRAVIDREVPGIAEAIRAGGLVKTPFAMLSRGICGQRGSSLILNLSGSPRAVREQLAVVLPVLSHVLATASGVPQTCGTSTPP